MLDSRYDGIFQYPQIVQDYWKNEPNYLIEYDECCDSKDYCAIYFVVMIFGFRIRKRFFVSELWKRISLSGIIVV